ncbi:hypothetical protein M5K25_015159 [Dendrobium thyrsiflorum]|uniref:Uncharacterized protein n=1 Tax=Dendrobium thyrsiflorum TaxID=117978 RepID=A0ABD0UQF7_DENTH
MTVNNISEKLEEEDLPKAWKLTTSRLKKDNSLKEAMKRQMRERREDHKIVTYDKGNIALVSSGRESWRIVITKERVKGSSRVHRCLALPTDDVLEEKARTNQIYWCCVHSCSWKEDTLLWETHTDLMRYPSYIDGASLNEEGWKYVQREVSQHAAHLAPISTLKAISAEIKRREDGSVVEFVENPMSSRVMLALLMLHEGGIMSLPRPSFQLCAGNRRWRLEREEDKRVFHEGEGCTSD